MTGKRKTARKAKVEEEVKPLMVSEASESLASSSTTTTTPTRRNASGTITRTDRYKNISDGLIPYKFTPGTGSSNRSNIDVRDSVILCQKAYYNFAAFRNVIDLMTEFSISDVYFKGGTKKSRDFFSAFFRKLNILGFQDRFFREYFRSGNVFIYRFDGKVQPEDMSKITQMYGASFAAEEKLPARYMILNPADIQLTGSAAFWNGNYYKVITSYLDFRTHRLTRTEKF